MSSEIKIIKFDEAQTRKIDSDYKRFKVEQNNSIVLTLTKGYTAPLRHLVDDLDTDRDTAEKIYTEVMSIAHKISRKYSFSLTEKAKLD